MTYTIRVLSEPARSAPARGGETILASLLAADVPFAHNCQAGNCGACKCELVEGDVLELPHSEYALSAEERSRQLILACRTQVWGDCTVRPLGTDETVLHPSRVLRCRLAHVAELTHDIKSLGLTLEAGGPYAFSAGQPLAMVEALQRELAGRGVALRDVHADAFYSQAEDAFNLS